LPASTSECSSMQSLDEKILEQVRRLMDERQAKLQTHLELREREHKAHMQELQIRLQAQMQAQMQQQLAIRDSEHQAQMQSLFTRVAQAETLFRSKCALKKRGKGTECECCGGTTSVHRHRMLGVDLDDRCRKQVETTKQGGRITERVELWGVLLRVILTSNPTNQEARDMLEAIEGKVGQKRQRTKESSDHEELCIIPETCSCCLDALGGNLPTTTLACSHEFHSECINKWLQTSGSKQVTCPICRAVDPKHCLPPSSSRKCYSIHDVQACDAGISAGCGPVDWGSIDDCSAQCSPVPSYGRPRSPALSATPSGTQSMDEDTIMNTPGEQASCGAVEFTCVAPIVTIPPCDSKRDDVCIKLEDTSCCYQKLSMDVSCETDFDKLDIQDVAVIDPTNDAPFSFIDLNSIGNVDFL